MKLWAISDLHLGFPANRRALDALSSYPDDWLILAGDVGETEVHLEDCLAFLTKRFARLIWAPGNHELYNVPLDSPRGDARYHRMVEICRRHDVLTPEDPYIQWPGEGPQRLIVPMFLLYDYSFAPDGMSPMEAVAWAAAAGVTSTDDILLHPAPYPTRADWCRARVQYTSARLASLPDDCRLILINHHPLRRDLVRLFRVPRYIPWCGTRATEDWHTRYPVDVVVSGHLHIRATDWRDGVRFEEVSLGYPQNWQQARGLDSYLREILPGPDKETRSCLRI